MSLFDQFQKFQIIFPLDLVALFGPPAGASERPRKFA
jgi:hypothetical protein